MLSFSLKVSQLLKIWLGIDPRYVLHHPGSETFLFRHIAPAPSHSNCNVTSIGHSLSVPMICSGNFLLGQVLGQAEITS